jgi:hypothetical protein
MHVGIHNLSLLLPSLLDLPDSHGILEPFITVVYDVCVAQALSAF